MHYLSTATKRVRLKVNGTAYQMAAGTTDTLTSDVLDTLGYDGVLFRVGFGAIAATGTATFKVQQCDTSGGSYADLTGTSSAATGTSDDLVIECEIVRPQERYLKTVITRATDNAAIDFVEAILFNPTRQAVDLDATILRIERFNTPIEGTA